jgi:hypothetical protein
MPGMRNASVLFITLECCSVSVLFKAQECGGSSDLIIFLESCSASVQLIFSEWDVTFNHIPGMGQCLYSIHIPGNRTRAFAPILFLQGRHSSGLFILIYKIGKLSAMFIFLEGASALLCSYSWKGIGFLHSYSWRGPVICSGHIPGTVLCSFLIPEKDSSDLFSDPLKGQCSALFVFICIDLPKSYYWKGASANARFTYSHITRERKLKCLSFNHIPGRGQSSALFIILEKGSMSKLDLYF